MKTTGTRIGRYEIKDGKLVKRPPRCVSARIAIAKSKKTKVVRRQSA